MKQVQLRLTVDGDHCEIHPICYHLSRAQYVDDARTIRWTCSKDAISVTHLVRGNIIQLNRAADSIPTIYNVEFTSIEGDLFYLHHNISIGEEARNVLADVVGCGVDIVPPIAYHDDGTATVRIIGQSEAIQRAFTRLPESLRAEVDQIRDFGSENELVNSVLTERQRDAILAAVELGYYETPREANQGDIAKEIDCAESTAGEHLRKAETKLLRAIVSGRYRHRSRESLDSQMNAQSLLP